MAAKIFPAAAAAAAPPLFLGRSSDSGGGSFLGGGGRITVGATNRGAPAVGDGTPVVVPPSPNIDRQVKASVNKQAIVTEVVFRAGVNNVVTFLVN